MEMETFRDILCRQMDTMQGYFDSSAEKNMGSNPHQHLDMRDDDDIGADVQGGSRFWLYDIPFFFICTFDLAVA